ncbi:MAG: Rrf2 family transcriptional regulator [Syntrophorhabdaceae bacterium]|nr:Rrf2 family transcriptional regulator [Syntrophorhabdaceae bacterium]
MPGILKHTDYASRIVLHIAGLGVGAQVPISEIATQRLMPAPFLRRVVARLAAAGILRTARGSKGGVSLARPASEISLMEVVRAMEGNIVLNRCVTEPNDCPFSDECPVRRTWLDITLNLEKSLENVTFDILLNPTAKTTRKRKEI